MHYIQLTTGLMFRCSKQIEECLSKSEGELYFLADGYIYKTPPNSDKKTWVSVESFNCKHSEIVCFWTE